MQYLIHHALTRQQLAPPMRVNDASITEIVNGNGTFTCSVPIDYMQPYRVSQYQAAFEPDVGACYVRMDDGTFIFGGPIVEQSWDGRKNTLSLTVASWRSWLYTVLFSPKLDLTGDLVYSAVNKDQLLIARELVALAVAGGTADGRPIFTTGTETSGKLRDLNVRGLDFKSYGELIDSIAKRSGGFEWDIVTYADNSDGLPSQKLVFGFPELGAVVGGMLLKRTPSGGNIKIAGGIPRSSTNRRSRVWATGSAETSAYAVDSDPSIAASSALLREGHTRYSSVTERTTLSSHARAEREFRAIPLEVMKVETTETLLGSAGSGVGAIGIGSYRAGDRCRLIYQDLWYDLDLPYVRIIERSIAPKNGAGKVQLTLDLSDAVLPEVDATGAV